MSQRIVSGVQPSGNLHLGNYLGAIKNWIKLQNNYESLFFVVDLHAITIYQDPKILRKSSLETVAAYVACGIDINKSKIFLQSHIASHSELSWLLSCITPIGKMNRMTQFKDKAGKNKEKSSLGLYAYPVLMAADILLYKPDLVPVGDDQKQHLELAGDIANKFNEQFKTNYFTPPKPIIDGVATRVMSLKDGNKKMSKSDVAENSRINLCDDRDLIIKKISKAKTDNYEKIGCDLDKRPEITNLINIYAALMDKKFDEIVAEFSESNLKNFKDALIFALDKEFIPIAQKFNEIKNDDVFLENILKSGRDFAQNIAQKHIYEIKNIMGFLQF